MKYLLYVLFTSIFFNATYAQTALSPNVTVHDSGVFMYVEQMPIFPGGNDALTKFLKDNVRYPVGIEVTGKVLIRFIVRKDGSITDIEVVRSLNPAYDAEALRVARLLPKFQPGKQQGHLVPVYFFLPVVFKTN